MNAPPRAVAYLRLGRVSNLPTVWSNVLAGVVLAGATPRPAVLGLLVAALSSFYIAGMFLNDAFDRGIDARERPERPLPSGLVSAREVFAIGAGLLFCGFLGVSIAAWLGGQSPARAGASALALGATIVLYDAWHKGNPLSPILMGGCRALVYLVAGQAVASRTDWPLVAGAASLLAYVVGLTYAAKQETRARLARLWPLALLFAPLAVLVPRLRAGVVPAAALGLLLLVWTVHALALARARRFGAAISRLIAGISLVDAMLIAIQGAPGLAVLAALGLPATLAGQRYVRGT